MGLRLGCAHLNNDVLATRIPTTERARSRDLHGTHRTHRTHRTLRTHETYRTRTRSAASSSPLAPPHRRRYTSVPARVYLAGDHRDTATSTWARRHSTFERPYGESRRGSLSRGCGSHRLLLLCASRRRDASDERAARYAPSRAPANDGSEHTAAPHAFAYDLGVRDAGSCRYI
jgi:hypothetical protein